MVSDIINGIAIENNKVYLSASVQYHEPSDLQVTWEQEEFSQLLRKEGKEAVYAHIGEELWSKDLFLESGDQTCNLFLKAMSAFPSHMDYTTFDCQTAGSLLAEMVLRLETDPQADLSEYVNRAVRMMNDRDYILETAKRTGMNYLNHASKSLQQDRSFALAVLNAGSWAPWFSYPTAFQDDKDFALKALELNGCFYRELGRELKADREVVMAAFRERPGKIPHEFLADQIPMETYSQSHASSQPAPLDREFIFSLLDACPSIQLFRSPQLLNDRPTALKWVQVGKFFPHWVTDLPMKYLKDREFQDVLIRRFKDTDNFPYLVQNFGIKGIQLPVETLESKIQSASSRTVRSSHVTDDKDHQR